MNAFLLLLLALASSFGYKQAGRPAAHKPTSTKTGQQVSAAASGKAFAFIRHIKKRELTASEFILVDRVASLNSNDCLQEALADKQFYTPAELAMLKLQSDKQTNNWKILDFQGIRLVRKDTVDAIFKVFSRHWTYFHAHVGRGFNEFSMPVFLRHDTYCLFYEANHCGGLCGGGTLSLYKREGKHWKIVKSYCQWVN